MTIYLEEFIIQNILINICLLRMVHLTTKSKTCFYKLLFSSFIGTASSIFISIFLHSQAIINISKLLTSILMICTAFQFNKKEFLFNYALLFIYTHAFAGFVINLNSTTYQTQYGILTISKFSLESICLIVIILSYLLEIVIKHLYLRIKTNGLIFNLKLTNKNKSIHINAYLDTGNFLNINGKPVLILDLNTFLNLINSDLIKFHTKDFNLIETKTINGTKKIKTFTIDKLEIKNKKIIYKNPIVAINDNNCFKNCNYKALISPLFL